MAKKPIKKSAVKKVVKKIKPAAKIVARDGKLVGRITHYFANIEVGVAKLLAPLTQGDEIRIVGGENTDFNQVADSIQLDHKSVKKAKKGDSVGLKVTQKVREGYRIFKV